MAVGSNANSAFSEFLHMLDLLRVVVDEHIAFDDPNVFQHGCALFFYVVLSADDVFEQASQIVIAQDFSGPRLGGGGENRKLVVTTQLKQQVHHARPHGTAKFIHQGVVHVENDVHALALLGSLSTESTWALKHHKNFLIFIWQDQKRRPK